MAFLNRVLIIGNLGADPELRSTTSGTPVTTLSVATNHVHTDAEGKTQETTEWHRVVVWSKQAELCAQYLAKGRTIFVEGRLQTRSWDDAQGQKRYVTEIVASTVQFLGGRDHGEDGGAQPAAHEPAKTVRPLQRGNAGGGKPQAPAAKPARSRPAPGAATARKLHEPDEDELPF